MKRDRDIIDKGLRGMKWEGLGEGYDSQNQKDYRKEMKN